MLKAVWPFGTIAAVILTVGGYMALTGEEKVPIRYKTKPVTRGTIASGVTATGMINPVLSVLVGAQVTGRVKSLHADFNSVVKAGDIIAEIDPAVYQARRDQAAANLATAQASVASASATMAQRKRELDRVSRLLEQQFVSQNDVDLALTLHQGAVAQLEVAHAQVKQAEAQLRAADLDLKYTVIRAPVDGIVIARNVEVGQTVTSGFQTPNLFLIAQDLARMQIDTSVSEADIGGITIGNGAAFTVDAYPSEEFTGTVKQVRLAPVNIQNVVTYNVVIEVDNHDFRLKPGMTAHVVVTVSRKDDVLRVPNAALRFTLPAPDRSALASNAAVAPAPRTEAGVPSNRVWKLGPSGMPEAVTVRLGTSDTQYIEILEGSLKEGEEVLIGVEAPRHKKADPLPPGFNPAQKRGKSRDGG